MRRKKNKVIITKEKIVLIPHAIKRASERLGIAESALRRVAPRAYNDGIGFYSENLPEELKVFIINKYNNYKEKHHIELKIKIYGNGAYCFRNKVLKTVLLLPSYYQPIASAYKKSLVVV